MRTLILLAGTEKELQGINGANVIDRLSQLQHYDPFYVTVEKPAFLLEIGAGASLPDFGSNLLRLFPRGRTMDDAFAEEIRLCIFSDIEHTENNTISHDELSEWILKNKGKYIVQVWA